MAWPKGRPRPRKVDSSQAPASGEEESTCAPAVTEEEKPIDPMQPPADWVKGQLLNVRNRGEYYVVTRWPDEYSPEHEDRCLKFTNLGECQAFVSAWYAHQHYDPRAR